MSKPLISILTPFKNTAKFLSECLDSICVQTYTNWELIIVDDGSTDESFDIVSSYSEKDSRIKLFKNKGNGIIEALRLAFNNSTGDYITRMDSDDIMYPEKLDVLLSQLESFGRKHIAVGLVRYFNEDGIKDGYKNYEAWINNLTKNGDNFFEIYKECVIPSPCWMLHRDDLITCDAFNLECYPEDYDLAFRFYKQKLICIPCDKVIHHWRDYATRTSRTHVHYAENHFIDLKLHYFLQLDYDQTRPLVIWGAGKKGKTIVKKLIEFKIPFEWICDNPYKIGKCIYGQELHSLNYLENLNKPQSIITVANKDAQKEIKVYFFEQQMKPMLDYFFFC